jgi:SagB-type dehydrogenase family enzyme
MGRAGKGETMTEPIASVLAYHEATKHHFDRYARGPGGLDWASQPDPFRRYSGAPVIKLEKLALTAEPAYDAAWTRGASIPAPLDRRSLSQFFLDTLALSAWKRSGAVTWALRVNPSSGNLHPIEGYALCGPIDGVCSEPMVAHYAPEEHALEHRASIPRSLWQRISAGLPGETILVGLTCIHWRESWKYGERAYRYCQLDLGHALGAISVAAAGLGWQAGLVDSLSSREVGQILGVLDAAGAEPEEAACLVLVTPQGSKIREVLPDSDAVAAMAGLTWQGRPSCLSRSHQVWPIIDEVAEACRKPSDVSPYPPASLPEGPTPGEARAVALRPIIQQRRSAQDLDGKTQMLRSDFYRMLLRTVARSDGIPFSTLPWTPGVHLAVFVHRIQELMSGLYLLVREPGHEERLRQAMNPDFTWGKPEGCPEGLDLYLLMPGDLRKLAMQLACVQALAADGCFSLAMIADFEEVLERHGPWMYPRLYWECGMIGQVLYLEAEAAGLRGCGIGCYFDDPMHELLGLKGRGFQDLYHFTVGKALEDPRITTLPAYP